MRIILTLFLLTPFPSWARNFEMAMGQYKDEDRTTYIHSTKVSTRIVPEDEPKTIMTLGYTGNWTTYHDHEALVVEQQLEGKNKLNQNSITVSLDREIIQGTQLGFLYGQSGSQIGSSQWYGASLGQWLREDTLQATLEYRKTSARQEIIEVQDTDGRRIKTPEDLDGSNFSLGLMHFTTPTTILKGSYSRTTSEDRPPANGTSFELRQFITATNSAAHFSASYYENVGEIKTLTLYGTVKAYTAKLEWHQRLYDRFILMGGYRYYRETEDPRDTLEPENKLGSDWLYTSLRWRPGTTLWTHDSHELYTFFGQYKTSEPRTGYLYGFGGVYSF